MRQTLFAICSLLLLTSAAIADDSRGLNIAKELSKAFATATNVAKPATVFIVAEGEAGGDDTAMHDPFGFFSDEFFGRHFGFSPHRRAQPRPQVARGSGFIVSEDGHIVTNYHVVQNAKKIKVTLNYMAKNNEYDAEYVGGDPQTDTAVIRIENPPKDLPTLQFANSDQLEVGEWVLAIGSPFELEASVTAGIVSATGRKNLQLSELENFIQTDAAINPGNSGGPLVNLEGEVVGINTAIVAPSGGNLGIGFAIPSNLAKNVMSQLVETGTVTRSYIGIELQPVTKDLAEDFGLEKAEGVIVLNVMKDSPGEKAGLKQGDVILEINDMPVTTAGSLRNEVMLSEPGKTVDLRVKRGEKMLSIPVKLSTDKEGYATPGNTQKSLGLVVEDITSDNVRRYRLGGSEEGVVVVDVDPRSIAGKAGIQPGYVIMGIDHKKITSVEGFDLALKEAMKKKKILLLVKQGNVTRFYSLKVK